jgi:hypothetical protein
MLYEEPVVTVPDYARARKQIRCFSACVQATSSSCTPVCSRHSNEEAGMLSSSRGLT